MATFGLGADDATYIADSFVSAADASISEVSDLTAALTTFGPTAATFNMTLGEVNQTLGILSERGIMGAEAGTALKSMLTNMMRPTKEVKEAWAALGISMYDAQGALRPFPQIIGDLSAALELGATSVSRVSTMTAEQTAELKRLESKYKSLSNSIRDYETGISGASLSEDKRNKKLGELRAALAQVNAQMQPLIAASGEYTNVVSAMTEQQRNNYIQTLAGTYGMKALQTLLAEGAEGWDDMGVAMEMAASAQEVGAERTKGFAAAMEQLQGTIQTFMITAGTPLIENVITPLIQKITEFAEKLIELDPKIITIGLAIAGVAAAIGPLLLILGGLATLIGALASPIGLIVLGVTALGAAFVAANGGIGPTIDRLREIGTTISNAVMPILDGLRAFWEWLWPYISQLFKYIWRDLEAFFGPLIADMAAFFELTFGYIKAWVDTNMPLIRETIVTILEAIQKVWDTVWPYLSDALRAVWEIMKGIVRLALTWVLGFITATMQAINGDWEGAWETVQETVGTAVDIVKNTIRNTLNAVKGTFGEWAQAGRDMIMGFVGGIQIRRAKC